MTELSAIKRTNIGLLLDGNVDLGAGGPRAIGKEAFLTGLQGGLTEQQIDRLLRPSSATRRGRDHLLRSRPTCPAGALPVGWSLLGCNSPEERMLLIFKLFPHASRA